MVKGIDVGWKISEVRFIFSVDFVHSRSSTEQFWHFPRPCSDIIIVPDILCENSLVIKHQHSSTVAHRDRISICVTVFTQVLPSRTKTVARKVTETSITWCETDFESLLRDLSVMRLLDPISWRVLIWNESHLISCWSSLIRSASLCHTPVCLDYPGSMYDQSQYHRCVWMFPKILSRG